jgi:hypothetical protein
MLRHLHSDDCLQALLPYCMRFAKTLIRDSPRMFGPLYVAVSVARALISNPTFRYLDAYLPDLLIISLTVLLSAPTLPKNAYEQVLLQDYAADTLPLLVDHAFRRMYANVQPQVTSQLVAILLTQRPQLTEKVGALIGLLHLGLETVANYVLPRLDAIVQEAIALAADADVERHTSGNQMYRQCLKCAGFALHADTFKMAALGFLPITAYSGAAYHQLAPVFGADLLPYVIDDAAMMCL